MAEPQSENEVGQTEHEDGTLEQRKKVLFGLLILSMKMTRVCHTCNEHVSRGGKSSRSFNTTNLRKHLEAHPDKFKEFSSMEEENAKEKSKGKRQVSYN